MSKGITSTDFQLFVLAYLYTQELSKYDRGLTHHPQYQDTPYKMNITQLTIISPPSVTPTTEAKVREDLVLLIQDNKIRVSNRKHDEGLSINAEKFSEEDTFSLTIDGRVFIKRYLGERLSSISINREEYEKAVKEQGFGDEVKGYFEILYSKLKNRSQDQAVDIILDIAKDSSKYLIPFISLIIKGSNPEVGHSFD